MSDLLGKFSCLLAFDFEAAVALKSWGSIDQLIKVALSSQTRSKPNADFNCERTARVARIQKFLVS